MAKFYNEIVIDMNPESSTFEETLYEDSFEHSGEVHLLQQQQAPNGSTNGGQGSPTTTQEEAAKETISGDPFTGEIVYYFIDGVWAQYKWSQSKGSFTRHQDLPSGQDPPPGSQQYATSADWREATGSQTHIDSSGKKTTTFKGSTQWGAANITKDDFIDSATGKQLTIEQVMLNLKNKGIKLSDAELRRQIEELAPQYEGVSAEDRAFSKEAYKGDVYGISKKAGKVGAGMRSAYGGTGLGMRAGIAGTADLSQQFGEAGQAYAKDIYGLEKGAEQAYEGEIEGWLEGMENPFGFKKGGRVPSKETFLELLTKLPEAGGS